MSKTEVIELPIKRFNVTEERFIVDIIENPEKLIALEEQYQATYKDDIRKLFAEGSIDILGYTLKNKENDIKKWLYSLNDQELTTFFDEIAARFIEIPLEEDSEGGALIEKKHLLNILLGSDAIDLEILNRKVFTDKLASLVSSDLSSVKAFYDQSCLGATSNTPQQIDKFFSFLFNELTGRPKKEGEQALKYILSDNPLIVKHEKSLPYLLDYAQKLHGENYIDLLFSKTDESGFIIEALNQFAKKGFKQFLSSKQFLADLALLDTDKGMLIFDKMVSEDITELLSKESICYLVFLNLKQKQLFCEIFLKYSDILSADFGYVFCLQYAFINSKGEETKLFEDTICKLLFKHKIADEFNPEVIQKLTYLVLKLDNPSSTLKSSIVDFLAKHINFLDSIGLTCSEITPLKKLGVESNLKPLIYDPLNKMENDVINNFLKKVNTNISSSVARGILIEKLVKGLLVVMKDDIACKILKAISEASDWSINLFSEESKTDDGITHGPLKQIRVFDVQKKLIDSDEKFSEVINTVLHEATHAVLYDFYSNHCETFVSGDIVFKGKFESIVNEILPELQKQKSPILLDYPQEKYSREIPAFFVGARVQKKINDLIGSKEIESCQDSVLLSNRKLNAWMENLAKALDKAVIPYEPESTDHEVSYLGDDDGMTDALDFI